MEKPGVEAPNLPYLDFELVEVSRRLLMQYAAERLRVSRSKARNVSGWLTTGNAEFSATVDAG